jgi:hypothetical protein
MPVAIDLCPPPPEPGWNPGHRHGRPYPRVVIIIVVVLAALTRAGIDPMTAVGLLVTTWLLAAEVTARRRGVPPLRLHLGC